MHRRLDLSVLILQLMISVSLLAVVIFMFQAMQQTPSIPASAGGLSLWWASFVGRSAAVVCMLSATAGIVYLALRFNARYQKTIDAMRSRLMELVFMTLALGVNNMLLFQLLQPLRP